MTSVELTMGQLPMLACASVGCASVCGHPSSHAHRHAPNYCKRYSATDLDNVQGTHRECGESTCNRSCPHLVVHSHIPLDSLSRQQVLLLCLHQHTEEDYVWKQKLTVVWSRRHLQTRLACVSYHIMYYAKSNAFTLPRPSARRHPAAAA